jgi:hypothetical protein
MNANQKVTQPSTSTPAPTPPDLRDFPQLDHPYTDIGGKCYFCVCPEAEHSDPYEAQSLVTHVGQAPPLALILTRRTTLLPAARWYILDAEDGSQIASEFEESAAIRIAEHHAAGYRKGVERSAQQLRPRSGA